MEEKQGLIAILDALGAANYSDPEIAKFLESRDRVLRLLKRKANSSEVRGNIEEALVSTFTFNDTVLIIYRTEQPATFEDVEHFSRLLRKFMVDSLAEGILFRGSLSLGTFYVDDDTNTVMGPAVSDGAAWYASAEWIGINTTPHAKMAIQSLIDSGTETVGHVLIDYDVPMKGGPAMALKAVNWPKAFVVPSLTPVAAGEPPRAKCLALLTAHRFPKGTETKHINAMAFFDYCLESWEQDRRKRKRKAG